MIERRPISGQEGFRAALADLSEAIRLDPALEKEARPKTETCKRLLAEAGQ